MKSLFKVIVLTAAVAVLAGCGGNSGIQYTDPTAVDNSSLNFGSTDLQTTAQKMTDSMLTFPPVVRITANSTPVLFVDSIKNETSQQINTDNISNMIMTELIQSGKFEFVDPSVATSVKAQLTYQQDSGLVDPASAMKAGTQIGAQYMMYGSVTNMAGVGSNGQTVSQYYLITMKLLDLKTGIIVWADQKQIRKVNNS